jgi:hypothetical protein
MPVKNKKETSEFTRKGFWTAVPITKPTVESDKQHWQLTQLKPSPQPSYPLALPVKREENTILKSFPKGG